MWWLWVVMFLAIGGLMVVIGLYSIARGGDGALVGLMLLIIGAAVGIFGTIVIFADHVGTSRDQAVVHQIHNRYGISPTSVDRHNDSFTFNQGKADCSGRYITQDGTLIVVKEATTCLLTTTVPVHLLGQ